MVEACDADDICVQSTIVDVANLMINAITYVKASNTEAGDRFGRTVALSGDGNTLVLGAEDEGSTAIGIDGDQADNSAGIAGAVYLY